MPTVNVTYNFTDSAEVSEFVKTLDIDGIFTGPFHETGDGNAAPCLRIHAANRGTGQISEFSNTNNTFEDFGVPAGSTITAIRNPSCDFKIVGNNYVDWIIRAAIINISSVIVSSGTADTAWLPDTGSDLTGLSLASTATCNIFLNCFADTNNAGNSYIDFHFDNLSFDIEYSAGAIPQSVGGSLTPSGSLASSLVKTITLAGQITPAGSLIASGGNFVDAAASIPLFGSLLARLGRTEQAEAYRRGNTELTINGVQYPVLQFNVKRAPGYESASVYIPLEYDGQINAADTFVLNYVKPDGSTTLYSGTVEYTRTEITRLNIFCTQAPTYGRNARRPVDDVYFIADTTHGYSVRSYVDARFVPSDEVEFLGRTMRIDTVTFYSSGTNVLMDLRNG